MVERDWPISEGGDDSVWAAVGDDVVGHGRGDVYDSRLLRWSFAWTDAFG